MWGVPPRVPLLIILFNILNISVSIIYRGWNWGPARMWLRGRTPAHSIHRHPLVWAGVLARPSHTACVLESSGGLWKHSRSSPWLPPALLPLCLCLLGLGTRVELETRAAAAAALLGNSLEVEILGSHPNLLDWSPVGEAQQAGF